MARQICAFKLADVLAVKNGWSVVLLERETAAFIRIVSGDDGNASVEQPVRKAAGAAEEIDGDGAAGRSIRVNCAWSRSVVAHHSKSI